MPLHHWYCQGPLPNAQPDSNHKLRRQYTGSACRCCTHGRLYRLASQVQYACVSRPFLNHAAVLLGSSNNKCEKYGQATKDQTQCMMHCPGGMRGLELLSYANTLRSNCQRPWAMPRYLGSAFYIPHNSTQLGYQWAQSPTGLNEADSTKTLTTLVTSTVQLVVGNVSALPVAVHSPARIRPQDSHAPPNATQAIACTAVVNPSQASPGSLP